MEAAPLMTLPQNGSIPNVLCSGGRKRNMIDVDEFREPKRVKLLAYRENGMNEQKCSPRVIDYKNPFAISHMLDGLDTGKYGSVTEDIKALIARRDQALASYVKMYPEIIHVFYDGEKGEKSEPECGSSSRENFIDLEDDNAANGQLVVAKRNDVILLSDDEDDIVDYRPFRNFQNIHLPTPELQPVMPVLDTAVRNRGERNNHRKNSVSSPPEVEVKREKGFYVGVEGDDQSEPEDDGLGDIWKQMSMAMECSKDIADYQSSEENTEDEEDHCDHSFVLKDDIGYVCRICGVIQKGIETIIEVQFIKKKSTRSYAYEPRNARDKDSKNIVCIELSAEDMKVTEISAHPRHMKQMKPHQLEGFNFLLSNLVTDNPGGCILAHAPGSGKTFMIISFMQSFLAKYPQARPLVVLPKGIISTWKKEFLRWQVEDIPLYDFYSAKADSRLQQLEVLKEWVKQKSILFLGYKQFSTIVVDDDNSAVAVNCRDILLKKPTILILDEGHTPRNEDTDVLQTLASVQTPRKVVLSGTLYQNHVKEVFNILNLVRPKFLRLDTSRSIVKRIMSKVNIEGVRKHIKSRDEASFYELVEHTIQKDGDFKRKVSVIQDLREMTSKVLHYYKGDFLDELPGLVDLAVVLNLSMKQKNEVHNLKKKFKRKFKRTSALSALYLHPKLITVPENTTWTDVSMDEFLEKIDVRDGAKAKFFLNMMNLCESAGEKLLVFSQYLTPLKFLERLVVKVKGWAIGKEIFEITGEANADQREWAMDRFNNSNDAKVFFGSIKACGEGISLVGASRIIILDVHLNPSVTRQAIGRAFRPGQTKKVYAYRLVAGSSPEEEDHSTCFRKEAIAKMWFEWNEYCGYRDFEVERIELKDGEDSLLESPLIREDIYELYKR